MANPAEPFEPDTIYHVYNHGNGDDLIFRENENYRFFLKRFKSYISHIAAVYAYCLMPNHFHFLIRIKPEEKLLRFFEEKYPDKDLSGFRKPDRSEKVTIVSKEDLTVPNSRGLSGLVSKQFSNLFNSYSKAFNKMYERRGRLFESSVERIPVRDDDYFTTMIRYIHFNPVLHGFVEHPSGWKYSSIHAFFSDKRSLIDRPFVLEWFGGLEAFQKFHQSIQEDGIRLAVGTHSEKNNRNSVPGHLVVSPSPLRPSPPGRGVGGEGETRIFLRYHWQYCDVFDK